MAYEKNEIEKILKSGNGFTSDEIFKKSELFDSKVELIRELRSLCQLHEVFKRGEKYYWYDQTPDAGVEEEPAANKDSALDPIAAEIRALADKAGLPRIETPVTESKPEPRVHVIQRKEAPVTTPPATEVTSKVAEKREKVNTKAVVLTEKTFVKSNSSLMGNFKRTNSLGKALYILYAGNAWFSLKDLAEIIGCTAHAVYLGLNNLDSNIVDTKRTGRSHHYRWSGHLKYPFAEVMQSDRNIVKNAPSFFKPHFEHLFKEEATEEKTTAAETPPVMLTLDQSVQHTDMAALAVAEVGAAPVTISMGGAGINILDVREIIPQDKEDIVRFIDLQISVHQVQIDALLQKRASLTA